ncbi:MAG: methyltransferase domain-containing protein [Desulfobacterium sp.]|nr:methyltransferase domain-containing protein [Desulfobacterium sp.]
MSDWQPDLYMQFKSERTQPSIDLVAKIDQVAPKTIIDMGCGPGNSTRILANRWPESKIIGIDSSAAMIEKAKQEYPNQEWQMANASTYESAMKFDVVFSNAVIQWIPNHEHLFTKFHALLSNDGVVAVQIPQFWDMPLGKIIENIATATRWKDQTGGVSTLFTIHDYSFYYDILSNLFNSIEIWETHYLHVLENHVSVLEMIRSTGLKPYLERLTDDSARREFEEAVLKEIREAYPIQKNGKVLLPFNRLFFTGRKSTPV